MCFCTVSIYCECISSISNRKASSVIGYVSLLYSAHLHIMLSSVALARFCIDVKKPLLAVLVPP